MKLAGLTPKLRYERPFFRSDTLKTRILGLTAFALCVHCQSEVSMNQLHHSEMGQRHLSTTWTLLRPRYGQWFVSEIRHYDHAGQVVSMPKRAVRFTCLKSALGSIPESAVEQLATQTLRMWASNTPVSLAS